MAFIVAALLITKASPANDNASTGAKLFVCLGITAKKQSCKHCQLCTSPWGIHDQ
jgi:hypothetical protein